ncbi:anti-sigma factor [Cytobacillus oceanisediminis]|uniref:anti-sigma factor n=1 Tax=Cytobacillus oceanisediminis TaxID=665099 RepID=UPI0020420B42|nr:anti-sigma factor [Cytobacillus oceanisediminis]MCM3406025.1 anti-sigma factor [Cytobacillus oceanisediminis]
MTENYCDTLIDYFNGHLDNEEKQNFERHLDKCPECKKELKEWESMIDILPYSSEPADPPSGMKERVMANILEGDVEKDNVEYMRKRKPRFLMPAMAAALFFSLAGNLYLLSNQDQENQPKEQKEIDQVLSYASLEPVKGTAQGTASIVKNGSQIRIVIQASKLQELKNDEVYQVWLIENEQPERAGTFVSSGNGEGAVVFELDKEENLSWDTVAITLEPDETSQTPKGSMVLASQLALLNQ